MMDIARHFPPDRLLRVASALGLVSLALMSWSLFDPTVWPVMVALSVGQAIGTFSFAMFLYVVARDLRKLRRLVREARARGDIPPSSTSLPPSDD